MSAFREEQVTPLPSVLLVALLAACAPGIDDGDALPVLTKGKLPAVRHCVHCGWIESKREIAPSLADPHGLQVYEYTVRMRDGSSSVFQETLPATWRLGERVTVIDGAGPPLH